jgi:hypothetical protein
MWKSVGIAEFSTGMHYHICLRSPCRWKKPQDRVGVKSLFAQNGCQYPTESQAWLSPEKTCERPPGIPQGTESNRERQRAFLTSRLGLIKIHEDFGFNEDTVTNQ